MEFEETPIFAERIDQLLSDDEFSDLQYFLALNPTAGDLISSGKGLRKLRWAVEGKGKRGGLRIIYYWVTADHKIILVTVYKKSEQENISKEEMKMLIEQVGK